MPVCFEQRGETAVKDNRTRCHGVLQGSHVVHRTCAGSAVTVLPNLSRMAQTNCSSGPTTAPASTTEFVTVPYTCASGATTDGAPAADKLAVRNSAGVPQSKERPGNAVNSSCPR